MTSAPLIIGSDVAASLAELRDRGDAKPVDMPTLAAAIETPVGKLAHMERMSQQTVVIPGPWPFVVTYSLETNHPSGTYRHASVSIVRDGRLPSPAALWMIAQHLGFTGGLSSCVLWPEALQGHGQAINLLQPA